MDLQIIRTLTTPAIFVILVTEFLDRVQLALLLVIIARIVSQPSLKNLEATVCR